MDWCAADWLGYSKDAEELSVNGKFLFFDEAKDFKAFKFKIWKNIKNGEK